MNPSRKINQILAGVLIAFLAIAFRAWHLGVIQRESLKAKAQKPQSKTIVVKAERGTICDRFGIPMAINRVSFNASIYYNQIAQIPALRWQTNEDGKEARVWPRKEYIRKLSEKLGLELQMDAGRIEDLIHSKASLFPHAPFLIKASLSEAQYYRLKGLEREWPGLYAEMGGERFYPLGKTGCHIIGTMGAISQKKYQLLADEQEMLKEIVSLLEQGEIATLPRGCTSFSEVYARLYALKEKAYTLSDLVGLSGVEAQFEEGLRGFFGKKIYAADLKGRLVKELPGGKEAISGAKITLSISAELQQFAESLLALNEEELEKGKRGKKPWIRGGAIIAMDPTTGEILTLASYPRFDPNDFTKRKNQHLSEWLENEKYIASVWDGLLPLSKERFRRRFFEEEELLTWGAFLEMILPKEHPVAQFFQKIDEVKKAIDIQEDFEKIHYLLKEDNPLQTAEIFGKKGTYPEPLKPIFQRLDPHLSPLEPKDRLFALDLCRLAVDSTRFSDELIQKLDKLKMEDYRRLCMEWAFLEKKTKEETRKIFHEEDFIKWRSLNQKEYLSSIRKGEKKKKTYPKPYLDYLDKKEEEMFVSYWSQNRVIECIKRIDPNGFLAQILKNLSKDLAEEFCKSLRSFARLDRPLLGKYRQFKTEKDLASAWHPKGGFGFIRSYAFQTGVPQGSVFKLITAYEGLRQGHNPVLIDHRAKDPKVVAYTLSGAPYPRLYKGGRLPRSSVFHIGKIDTIGALEQTSNPYFSILAGDLLSDPEDLKKAAFLFGYGQKTGIELPAETTGNLPNDLKTNRTGLYSFAIGQHTLLSTPLQSAVALSALANGGNVLRPQIALSSVSLTPDRKDLSLFEIKNSFMEKELKALGIPFSLFTAVQKREPLLSERKNQANIQRKIPISQTIRSQILEGMDRTIWGEKGSARPSSIRLLKTNPLLAPDFHNLKHQMIGKTGTAQILHNFFQHPSSSAEMVTYTWFGALAFSDTPNEKRFESPELVVIVFSRFADSGKEGAPLAAQMIKKWREIKKKHG